MDTGSDAPTGGNPRMAPSPDQQPANNGPGIYAVPMMPSFMGHPKTTAPINILIPLTYKIPSRPNAPEGGAGSEEHGHGGGQRPQAPQRQVVVRRFEFAFQVDLLLLLKLVAVILVFNQDGSRQRLVLLLFLAALVYLYQTGVLTPLIRRIAHAMHMVPAPAQPRQAIQAENGGLPIRPEGEQAGAENQSIDAANQLPGNENRQGLERHDENNLWRIVKEIKIIVVGFITSLLPGFHNVD